MPSSRPPSRAWLALFLVGLSCGGHRDALLRGQRYYEENRYELALAVLRRLERDAPHLGPREQVRYAYLRGMTDYRLGYRRDAHYWLSLTLVEPSQLDPRWLPRIEAAVADLGAEVFGSPQNAEAAVQSIHVASPTHPLRESAPPPADAGAARSPRP